MTAKLNPDKTTSGKVVVFGSLAFFILFTIFMIYGTRSCAKAMEPMLRERQQRGTAPQ
jgi:hypothetical protein